MLKMAELKFQESYVTEQAADIKKKCDALEKGIDDYRKILSQVTEKAIMKGVTNEALDTFNSLVGELDGKLEEVGANIDEELEKFISDVDTADDYTF